MKCFLILVALSCLLYRPALSESKNISPDVDISCQTADMSVIRINPPAMPGPASKKVKWVLNHLEVMDGWAMTGRSWVRVNKNFTPYRIKIGIINSDITALANEDSRNDIFWRRNVEEERRRGLVFGFSFGIKF